MKPKDLYPWELKEKGALTETNGCTIYAIAGAIAILEPDKSFEEIATAMKSLISVPIDETPLYPIAVEHNLPAPLLLVNGATTDTQWIEEGHGDILMDYINKRFIELGVNLEISYKKFEDLTNEQWLEECKQGKVLIPHFQVIKGDKETGHSISVGYVENELCVLDINQPLAQIPEQLFIDMFNDSNLKIPYLKDGTLAVNRLPILILSKKK